jgi:ferrochelatase
MKNGLLLINLGTPETPQVSSVRRYLKEFLADQRVIDLPAPLRYILLYCFILPFRPKVSAHAYQAIWTKEGSPLLVNSEQLVYELQKKLGDSYDVALGMRYGQPSLSSALAKLSHCDHLTILPLYPQYSSAATGSSIEKILQLIATRPTHPSLHIIRDFYQHPGFINAQAAIIQPYIADHDYVLFSYHGIPQRHIVKAGCQNACVENCPTPIAHATCYRAQCYETTRALVEQLHLQEGHYSTAFQSRLGKTPWIEPYTDIVLSELAKKGIKRLAVSCPSFTVDCLETLEEIGIRAKEQWQALGGEKLTLIPCVNASELWLDGIIKICKT